MITVTRTTRPLPLQFWTSIRIWWVEQRIRAAEADLKSYRSEVRYRIAQMRLHRRHCGTLRIEKMRLEK